MCAGDLYILQRPRDGETSLHALARACTRLSYAVRDETLEQEAAARDGDHAHGSQRAASVADSGALTGTHRIDPLQCARGIRRRRRPWISIVRGGYHRVTDLTSGRSDYGASVGIPASQLLRHCATAGGVTNELCSQMAYLICLSVSFIPGKTCERGGLWRLEQPRRLGAKAAHLRVFSRFPSPTVICLPQQAPVEGRVRTRAAPMGCGGSTPAAAAVAPKGDGAVAPKGDGPTKKAERRSSFSIDQRMSLQFDRVMDDHVGLETLLKFAKKEFNEEQLLFWIDVMKMKRDLADTTIWETDGKNAAAPPVATASAAPVPASEGGGGAPDIFGGFDEPPTSNGGNAFDGDNMFDNDVATHSSGLGSADAVLSSEPPPEAATGDRAGFLRRRCAELIDKYLCNGADFQCTMPDHKYKVKCAAAQPPYDFEEGMFDTFQDLAYKQVRSPASPSLWRSAALPCTRRLLTWVRPPLLAALACLPGQRGDLYAIPTHRRGGDARLTAASPRRRR